MKKTQLVVRLGAALAVLAMAAPALPCEAMRTTMAVKETQVTPAKDTVASKTAAQKVTAAKVVKQAKTATVATN